MTEIKKNGTAPGMADPELVERAQRRRYSAQYKLEIVREADACTEPGEVGALLRREGLYTSHLTYWRKQRDGGALDALGRPRGRSCGLQIKRFQDRRYVDFEMSVGGIRWIARERRRPVSDELAGWLARSFRVDGGPDASWGEGRGRVSPSWSVFPSRIRA